MIPTTRPRTRPAALLVLVLSLSAGLALAGCGSIAYDMAPGAIAADAGLGATAGGAQDIAHARHMASEGIVPTPESFPAEGLFSEHDIPTPGPEADRLLSLRPGVALVRFPDSESPSALVQVGMASNLDPSTFRRTRMNLAVVLDISGSMSGPKIEASRRALHRLVDQLGQGDRLAIVLFDDDAEVLVESTEVDAEGKALLHEEIDGIETDGATNMEAGMRLGYEEVAPHSGRRGVGDRVLLFTDALPNTGDTSRGSFLGLARTYGEDGIGLTVFGVGLDMGAELARAVSEVPGGNSVYLTDEDRIGTVFDTDFDYLVTPIAYRLRLRVEPAEGFEVVETYGVPGEGKGVDLEIATVFVSRNKGAIAVRLSPTSGAFSADPAFRIATLRLSYTTVDGETHEETIRVDHDAGSLVGTARWYSAPGPRLLATLVEEHITLREASAAFHDGDAERADELLAGLEEHLDGEIEAGLDGLETERDLVRDLRKAIGEEIGTALAASGTP